MSVLTMMQQLQQRQQEELMKRSQEAEAAASSAQQSYQQAAAEPVPQVGGMEALIPTLLGNVASVIAQDPSFRARGQETVRSKQSDLLKARADNLSALRDVYSQKAGEAEKAGDLEQTEKYRRQFELLSKTLDTLGEQQKRADKKAAEDEETPDLTEPAKDMAALAYAKGMGLPPLGAGKAGTRLRAQIIDRAARMNPGLDLAANQAQYRADRTSLGNLQKLTDSSVAWEKTALKNSDLMLKKMEKISNTGAPWLNLPIRSVALSGLGSADQAAFNAAKTVVIPEFARLLSSPTGGGVLSDAARKEVDEIINGNYSYNQMVKAMDILKQDAANRRGSYEEQITEIKGRLARGVAGTQTPPPAAAPTDTATVVPTGKLVKMVDTRGKTRTIDSVEVERAIKAGWKRAPVNGR
jgi:hypothetical protein